MKVYVQGEEKLIPLQEELSSKSIENALGYTPADEANFTHLSADDTTSLIIVDSQNNVITQTDTTGFHAAAITVNSKDVESGLVSEEERQTWNNKPDYESIDENINDSFYVVDNSGNKLLQVDTNGVSAAEFYLGSAGTEPVALSQELQTIKNSIPDLPITKDETDAFYLRDNSENVLLQVDTNGTRVAELYIGKDTTTPVSETLSDLIADVNALEAASENYATKDDLGEIKIPDVSDKLDTSVFNEHEENKNLHIGGDISLDENSNFYITDKEKNILFQVEQEGTRVTELYVQNTETGVTNTFSNLHTDVQTLKNAGYITKNDIPGEYITEGELTEELKNYAKTGDIPGLDDYVTDGELAVALNDYTKTADLPNMSEYAKTSDLDSKVNTSTFTPLKNDFDTHKENKNLHMGGDVSLDENSNFYVIDNAKNILLRVNTSGAEAAAFCEDGVLLEHKYFKQSGGTMSGTITMNGHNISGAGTVQAAVFQATSDKRLKENIEPYKSSSNILSLPVYKYDFIDGPKEQIGCLAQDLKEICPELVRDRGDGFLAINENKLVYLLLEEIKRLDKEIKNLKKEG